MVCFVRRLTIAVTIHTSAEIFQSLTPLTWPLRKLLKASKLFHCISCCLVMHSRDAQWNSRRYDSWPFRRSIHKFDFVASIIRVSFYVYLYQATSIFASISPRAPMSSFSKYSLNTALLVSPTGSIPPRGVENS